MPIKLKEKKTSRYEDPVFGPVISEYTQEQAIEDGILFPAGWIIDKKRKKKEKVIFTTNLLFSEKCTNPGLDDCKDEKEYRQKMDEVVKKRAEIVKRGIELLKRLDPEDTEYMQLRVIEKEKIWVIRDANGLTFMKPEDY